MSFVPTDNDVEIRREIFERIDGKALDGYVLIWSSQRENIRTSIEQRVAEMMAGPCIVSVQYLSSAGNYCFPCSLCIWVERGEQSLESKFELELFTDLLPDIIKDELDRHLEITSRVTLAEVTDGPKIRGLDKTFTAVNVKAEFAL